MRGDFGARPWRTEHRIRDTITFQLGRPCFADATRKPASQVVASTYLFLVLQVAHMQIPRRLVGAKMNDRSDLQRILFAWGESLANSSSTPLVRNKAS